MRIADDDGHLWPVTGTRCAVCGMPLTVVAPDQAAHPGCEPARASDTLAAVLALLADQLGAAPVLVAG